MNARGNAAAPVVYRPTGSSAPRLRGWNLLIAVSGMLAVVIAVANVVVLVGRTDAKSACPAGHVCLPPAHLAQSIGRRWVSRELHFSFEYPAKYVEVAADDARSVHLTMPGYRFRPEIWISGVPVAEKSLEEALQDRLDSLKREIPDLAKDDTSDDRIPAPGFGFRDGIGGSYAGTASTLERPRGPAQAAVVAVSVGRISVVLSFVVSGDGLEHRFINALWSLGADLIVDTFRWS